MVKGMASAPLRPMVKATKARNIAVFRSLRTSLPEHRSPVYHEQNSQDVRPAVAVDAGPVREGKAVMSLTDEWLALGHRLFEKGKAIFDHSSVLESEAGTKDPKVVALTLLAR